MLFRSYNSLLIFLNILSISGSVFACGTPNNPSPCGANLTNPTGINQYPMRQEQTVAALQQQAARGLIELPGTYKGVVPKDDTFTVSSLRSEYGPEIQIVAKIDYRTDRHMVTLLFRGERIGYSIDENIFGAMLKNKQVVSIGEQYAVMSGEQMNLIKGMVISDSNKKSSRIQANGNLVETVSY